MMTRAIPTCANTNSCASVWRQSLSNLPTPSTNSRLVAVARPVSAARPSAGRQPGGTTPSAPGGGAPARRTQPEPHAEMRETKAQKHVRSGCPRSHDWVRERETDSREGLPRRRANRYLDRFTRLVTPVFVIWHTDCLDY